MTVAVAIVGAPASGKSTLTDGLRAVFPEAYSFGARRYFTAQKELGTPLGQSIMKYRQGDWIPDEIVVDAIRAEYERGLFDSGVIFEGVPAKRRQAELMDVMIRALGRPFAGVIHVATPMEVCLQRALMRRVCQTCDFGSHQAIGAPGRPAECARCGGVITRRPNDNEVDMRLRLQEYQCLAPDLLDHYSQRSDVLEVDGRSTPREILDTALAWIRCRTSGSVSTVPAARSATS